MCQPEWAPDSLGNQIQERARPIRIAMLPTDCHLCRSSVNAQPIQTRATISYRTLFIHLMSVPEVRQRGLLSFVSENSE